MPYNRTRMELRLSRCDENLSKLFAIIVIDEVIGPTLQSQIKAVQEYYNTSYQKAKDTPKVENIISRYEEYIKLLTKVNEGKSTAEEVLDVLKKDVLKKISYNRDSRKIDVIFSNLAKACELLFWAAAAITLFSSIFMIALPIVIVQPPLGIAIMIAVGGLLLKSAINCFNCFREFRTLGRHRDEYLAENKLLNGLTLFNKPQQPVTLVTIDETDTTELENTEMPLNASPA